MNWLEEAESMAVEHCLWMRYEGWSINDMYRAINVSPRPSQGGNGVIEAYTVAVCDIGHFGHF
jgi:hypothetical protein